MNKTPALCLALLLCALGTACGEGAGSAEPRQRPAPVAVETRLVSLQPVARSAEAVGTLLGNESVTLTAKVTERVSAVHFEGGEVVREGQTLVELIDQEQLALLREAEAKLEETRLQLQRLVSLGAQIATAAEIDAARMRVNANEAVLEALRSRISERNIRAPFTGIVGFRQISVGALLTPGAAIAELDDIDPLKLEFTLPEHLLSQVAVGDAVSARSAAWGDMPFRGAVTRIGTRIDPVTRAFTVRALLGNEQGRLRPGMLMVVDVSLGASAAIVVPETALLQSGARSSVYVVDAQSVARRVSVQIGRRLPGAIEIREGIDPGDRVVTSGQLTLRPGVRVREARAANPPAAMRTAS